MFIGNKAEKDESQNKGKTENTGRQIFRKTNIS